MNEGALGFNGWRELLMLVVGGSSGDSCAAPSLAFTWEMENGVLWLLLLWMELGALLSRVSHF